MRQLAVVLALMTGVWGVVRDASACANPYADKVVGASPMPGATNVARNATIGFWVQNLFWDEQGLGISEYPGWEIQLLRVSTGEVVSGASHPIEAAHYDGVRGVAFVPDTLLAPNETYEVVELGYQFTTGASSIPTAASAPLTATAEVFEQAVPYYDYCDEVEVGICISGLTIGHTYPVMVRLKYDALTEPSFATASLRYRAVEESSGNVLAATTGATSEGNTLKFKISGDAPCYRVVADALDGTVVQSELICVRRDEAVPTKRLAKPDVSNAYCDEWGQWQFKDDNQVIGDPLKPKNDPPDDPLVSRGCALGASAPSAMGILALLVLVRRRRR